MFQQAHIKKNDLPNPDAASVKARVDLVGYVSRFTHLRPFGRQFVGLCPLHQERHSSFFVDPIRQVFFCHGCQRGGDVFSFEQFRRGCSFPEAVREVAQFIGPEVQGVAAEPTPKAEARFAPRVFAGHAASWATPHRGEPKATFVDSQPRDLPPSFFSEVATRGDVLRYQCGQTAVMDPLVSSLVQRRITDFPKGEQG